jgi:hypothetical protein
MRAGTNTKLPLNARSKTGPIEFAGGKAKVRVYFKLVGGSSKDDAIEALVGHAEKPLRVKITWTTPTYPPRSITDWGYAECLVPQRLSGVITSQ